MCRTIKNKIHNLTKKKLYVELFVDSNCGVLQLLLILLFNDTANNLVRNITIMTSSSRVSES